MQWFLLALAVVNGATLLCYGADKLAALLHWRRIPERTLLALALLGGSLGALLGMAIFRHKISKESFQFPLAIILFAQVAAVLFFLDFLE